MRLPEWIRQSVFARDNHKCTRCGEKGDLVPHHVIPKCEGGTYAQDNLITLCKKCHVIKHKWMVCFTHRRVPVLTDPIGTYYKYEDEENPEEIDRVQAMHHGHTKYVRHDVYPETGGG